MFVSGRDATRALHANTIASEYIHLLSSPACSVLIHCFLDDIKHFIHQRALHMHALAVERLLADWMP
jgi:hypothetical protein